MSERPPTARELEEDAKRIDPWLAVLDYLDGWKWPVMTFEEEAELIASFYEELDG